MKETFTIEEIKNYILSQDNLGDVLYNLSAKNIIDANDTEDENNGCCEDGCCGCNCGCGE